MNVELRPNKLSVQTFNVLTFSILNISNPTLILFVTGFYSAIVFLGINWQLVS